MTIRTDFLQVGVSNTATQNFTLKTNNDGTAKLARGNFDATTQDVINVNASGVVDFPQGATIGGSAGQKMLLTASQATTSGTFVDFTGIPSWAKKVTVNFADVSLAAAASPLIQIGAGAFETTGYSSTGSYIGASSAGGTTSTAGFVFGTAGAATDTRSGSCVLTLLGSNIWVASGAASNPSGTVTFFVSGSKTASGQIDRIRITPTTGAFDAGSVSLLIEGY